MADTKPYNEPNTNNTLKNKAIVITRPESQAVELANKVLKVGGCHFGRLSTSQFSRHIIVVLRLNRLLPFLGIHVELSR